MLDLSIDSGSASQTRFTFRLAEGGFAVYEARSATIATTTRGLGIRMSGPGRMSVRGQSTSFENMDLQFFDGQYLQIVVRS